MSLKKEAVRGFVVKSVPGKMLRDYAGMNYYSAKVMGFTPLPKRNEILVDKKYKGAKKTRVIKHEMEEAHLMSRGYPYFVAHKIALHYESKKFPKWGRVK
jgi:hypothetical protein